MFRVINRQSNVSAPMLPSVAKSVSSTACVESCSAWPAGYRRAS